VKERLEKNENFAVAPVVIKRIAMLSRRDGDDFCARLRGRGRGRGDGAPTRPASPDSAASAAIRYARYTHRAIEAIEATRWTTRVVSIESLARAPRLVLVQRDDA